MAEKLRAYDTFDLLASVAALQLVPHNASHIVRLEALAHVCLSLPPNQGPNITTHRLLGVCNNGVLGHGYFAVMEDHNSNLFTESLTFFGGGYTVFTGIAEEGTFILNHLLKAIFLGFNEVDTTLYQRRAYDAALIALTIGNEVARRIGAERGTASFEHTQYRVMAPDARRLNSLKNALYFTQAEISDLIAPSKLNLDALDDLTTTLGVETLDEYDFNCGTLLAKPLVKFGEHYLLALPGALVSATRHLLISTATQRGVAQELAQSYCMSVWMSVKKSFKTLGFTPVPLDLPPSHLPATVREGAFSFDTDKVVYALLYTSAFEDYEVGEVYDGSQTLPINELLSRFERVKSYLWSLPHAPNDILFLVVNQGVGKGGFVGFDLDEEAGLVECLTMSASELETLSYVEGGKHLLLWQYARASRLLRKSVKVGTYGLLDEFAFYRSRDYSYYLSDEGKPGLLSIQPGTAAELYKTAQDNYDVHAAPGYVPGTYLEVMKTSTAKDYPVYAPLNADQHDYGVCLLVEGLPLPIWVQSHNSLENMPGALVRLTTDFADTVSYWMWQFTPFLALPLERLEDYYCLILTLSLAPELAGPLQGDAPPEEDPLTLTTDVSAGRVHIVFNKSYETLLFCEDNRAERHLMKCVLTSLASFLPLDERGSLSDSAITEAIEIYAPLGIKRKTLLFSADMATEADPSALPNYRDINDRASNEVRDEIGIHLIKDLGYSVGRFSPEQARDVLKQCVRYLYQKIEYLVASLNPEGLLEALMAQSEAVIRVRAHYQYSLGTRLACFNSNETMVQVKSESSEQSLAAMASRFVIEYVVATPPSGVRPFSLSVYDRLQALASEIINFGHVSDLLHFDLSDVALELLPSARLVVERDDYERAMMSFLTAHSTVDVNLSEERFRDLYKPQGVTPAVEEKLRRINEGLKDDCGYTLSELFAFIGKAVDLHDHRAKAIACFEKEKFVQSLAAQLGWTQLSVEGALNLLSLSPREAFLKPKSPLRAEDVYPWRFNRALSYLRRPFILRSTGTKTYVLWGNRALFQGSRFTMSLVGEGRMRTQSQKLRQVLGEINHENAEGFNDAVAEVYARNKRLIVMRRVEKFARQRIRSATGDLGDIDVFVVDPVKRIMLCIECKNLKQSFIPYDLWGEMETLILGNNPVVERHMRRTQWVKDHLDTVLNSLNLTPNKRWRVKPLIVVSQELAGPFLQKSPVPIVSIHNLKQF